MGISRLTIWVIGAVNIPLRPPDPPSRARAAEPP